MRVIVYDDGGHTLLRNPRTICIEAEADDVPREITIKTIGARPVVLGHLTLDLTTQGMTVLGRSGSLTSSQLTTLS